jgi:hypothetical protein
MNTEIVDKTIKIIDLKNTDLAIILSLEKNSENEKNLTAELFSTYPSIHIFTYEDHQLFENDINSISCKSILIISASICSKLGKKLEANENIFHIAIFNKKTKIFSKWANNFEKIKYFGDEKNDLLVSIAEGISSFNSMGHFLDEEEEQEFHVEKMEKENIITNNITTTKSNEKFEVLEYRFDYNDLSWKKYLEENGFVVVSNVLSEEESSKTLDSMWSVLEYFSEGRLNKNDSSTWSFGKNYPFLIHGGMIQYLGHTQFQWDLREKCSGIFSKIFNVKKEELATSFDGWCFMNGNRRYIKKPVDSFLHSDQSPKKDFLWSYQGLINLVDCDDESGGFVCVPKSHLIHNEFFKKNFKISEKRFASDWILFSDEEKSKYKDILSKFIKVNCKAGDFVLWDSRTFHCNTVPVKKVIRACSYICMLPKSHISEENIVIIQAVIG